MKKWGEEGASLYKRRPEPASLELSAIVNGRASRGQTADTYCKAFVES